ncbi:MAG: hypothetical protein AB8B36_08540 [Prochlorococcus sp.]
MPVARGSGLWGWFAEWRGQVEPGLFPGELASSTDLFSADLVPTDLVVAGLGGDDLVGRPGSLMISPGLARAGTRKPTEAKIMEREERWGSNRPGCRVDGEAAPGDTKRFCFLSLE